MKERGQCVCDGGGREEERGPTSRERSGQPLDNTHQRTRQNRASDGTTNAKVSGLFFGAFIVWFFLLIVWVFSVVFFSLFFFCWCVCAFVGGWGHSANEGEGVVVRRVGWPPKVGGRLVGGPKGGEKKERNFGRQAGGRAVQGEGGPKEGSCEGGPPEGQPRHEPTHTPRKQHPHTSVWTAAGRACPNAARVDKRLQMQHIRTKNSSASRDGRALFRGSQLHWEPDLGSVARHASAFLARHLVLSVSCSDLSGADGVDPDLAPPSGSVRGEREESFT